jgi:hypothetical protein
MAKTKDEGGLHRGTIVGAVVVVVVAALVVVLARGTGRSREPAADDQGGEGPAVVERHGRSDRGGGGGSKATDDGTSTKRRKTYGHDQVPEKIVKARWNPIRPLRFVAKYGPTGGGRSEDEARRLVEQVRQKVMDGEESWGLIRDLSDPPSGLPRELVMEWVKLAPNEASPVIAVDDGFVVFFGAPSEPPASYLSPPEKAPGGDAD